MFICTVFVRNIYIFNIVNLLLSYFAVALYSYVLGQNIFKLLSISSFSTSNPEEKRQDIKKNQQIGHIKTCGIQQAFIYILKNSSTVANYMSGCRFRFQVPKELMLVRQFIEQSMSLHNRRARFSLLPYYQIKENPILL